MKLSLFTPRILVMAALLLTPAHPNAEAATYAPALIVAVFESLTHGPEAAVHAFKPLVAMLAFALVLAILLQLALFRRRSRAGHGAKSADQTVSQAE